MECKFCRKSNTGGISYIDSGGNLAFACWECKTDFEFDYKNRINKELQELKILNLCRFNLAWIGWCKKPGYPFCDNHKKEVCRVCKKQATHQCPVAGSLVCGISLCDNCKCPIHKGD